MHHLLKELKRFDLVCVTVNGVDLQTGFNEDDFKYFCEVATIKFSYFWFGTAWFKNGNFAKIRNTEGGDFWEIIEVPKIPERLKEQTNGQETKGFPNRNK